MKASRAALIDMHASGGSGLSVEAMDRHPKLKEFFRVTALATDRDGGVYVANLEARDYPITATQWHPVRRCLRPTCLWLAH